MKIYEAPKRADEAHVGLDKSAFMHQTQPLRDFNQQVICHLLIPDICNIYSRLRSYSLALRPPPAGPADS